jgi:hypothetical protein
MSESFGLSCMMRMFEDNFGQIWQIDNPILTDKGLANKRKFNLARKL